MGLCFYVSGDIERCTLLERQNYSDISSMIKKDQDLVKSEYVAKYSPKDEKLYPVLRELKSAGNCPSAKCHNAVVTSQPSGKKLTGNSAAKSSVISWVSNPANHINVSCKLSKDIGTISLSTPQATARESSVSSTYVSVPMTAILPNLYLGSYDNAVNVRELQANGITHILSLIGNKSPVDFVQHENFPMHDGGRTDLKGVLSKVSEFVKLGQKDGNSVLVHCQWGQNRSAVVVIALMMIHQKETLYCAHKKVKNLRPVVQINETYAKQLLALEKELFGKNSLPCEWMERGEYDILSGEVTYKYEHVNSAEHRAMFDS